MNDLVQPLVAKWNRQLKAQGHIAGATVAIDDTDDATFNIIITPAKDRGNYSWHALDDVLAKDLAFNEPESADLPVPEALSAIIPGKLFTILDTGVRYAHAWD